jgi:hypothetical protein
MLNDIAAFLKEMPVKHYLRGGLFSTKEPTLVFSIGGDSVEALAAGARGGGVGYERSLEKDNDAPPLATGHSNLSGGAGSRTLSRKLSSRYRLGKNVRHLFVVDAPIKDQLFVVTTLEKWRHKTVASALEELHDNPQQVFGSWEHAPFRWAITNREINLGVEANPRIDEPILVMGMDNELCSSLEAWSDSQEAAIMAILPLSVAALAWCNATLPTKERDSLIVVATDQGAVGAAFKRRSLIYISEQYESASDAFSTLEMESDELSLEQPVQYLWSLNHSEERLIVPKDVMLIDQENIQTISGYSLDLQEGHGKKIKQDRAISHLLNWLINV